MLNTPITPPRVPLVDERTGLIDRSWYMFFLSLFDAATQVYDADEAAPNASSLVASYDAAIRALANDVQTTPPVPPAQPVDDAWKLTPSSFNQPQDESWKLAPPIVPITDYGTVTSVAATVPSFLTVTGSPITTSGTLAFDYSGTPLPIAYGGIGATSFSGADLPTLSGNNTFSGVMTTTGQNNQFTALTYATTDGIGGVNAYLGEDTAYAVLGGVNGVVFASGSSFPGTGRVAIDPNTMRPWGDNVLALGTGSFRYTTVYATNGTINTSDATEKQQVRELTEAERRVAARVKTLIRAFKWNDAVQAKGDAARTHIGVMAQDVQAAFAAEGLDASKYGLFCSDTWTTSDGASQTRLGVRYDELLAFVIAAL